MIEGTTTEALGDLLASIRDRRDARFADRSLLWSFSALPRCRNCGRVRIDASRGVGVLVKEDRAHFDNLQSCGSVWACPVCSAKIRFRRAGEVTTILAAHLSGGAGASFLTLTAPHDRTERLTACMVDSADAWRYVTGLRSWKAAAALYGVEGFIRTMEVTHGNANGWHAHLHIALLTTRPLSTDELAGLESALYPLWVRAIERQGRGTPSRRHGIDLRLIRDGEGMAQYLVKVEGAAMELTFADRKKGRHGNRTPMQILGDARSDGDSGDVHVFNEYERASKGKRMLTMSRGLKRRYLIEDISDDEIVSEVIGGERVIDIEGVLWSELVRSRTTGDFLRLVEEHGPHAAMRYLETIGANE